MACTPLMYAIAAAPLLVAAACSMDGGLKGRVMYGITVTIIKHIFGNIVRFYHQKMSCFHFYPVATQTDYYR